MGKFEELYENIINEKFVDNSHKFFKEREYELKSQLEIAKDDNIDTKDYKIVVFGRDKVPINVDIIELTPMYDGGMVDHMEELKNKITKIKDSERYLDKDGREMVDGLIYKRK